MKKHKIIAEFFSDSRAVAGLNYALHSFSDAESRWNKLRESGATDKDILRQISYEFGIQGGVAGPGMYHCEFRGKENPKFQCRGDEVIEIDEESTEESDENLKARLKLPPLFELTGEILIAATRKLIGIPSIEPSLFAESDYAEGSAA
jgi:hypothetical protein